MKREFLKHLSFKGCRGQEWKLIVDEENDKEIRKGKIQCPATGTEFKIEDGVLNMLGELPPEVVHEKEHAESFSYLKIDGQEYPINRETLNRFKPIFLSLPTGDGSSIFQPGGSFDNQAGNAERFFKTLDLLNLKGGEKVLEVGSSFTWSAWRFAQRGCSVVALDVTNYLLASDLYMESDGTYYERVMADMSQLPFEDQTFDIIFSHSVIHHCQDLGKMFKEFYRVLKPGGRVVALHECSFGLLEDKSGAALQEAIHEGFNENAYTVPQWKKGAMDGGFKSVRLHFFSFIDDYLYRKKIRKAQPTFKIKMAEWIQSKLWLNHLLNQLSIFPRILLRPKAWMMIASK